MDGEYADEDDLMLDAGHEEMEGQDHEDAEEEERRKAEERARILDALGMELAKTRSEAIAGRRASGIEDEWVEDEEFYEGIDDANRGDKGVRHIAWRSKPAGQAALPSPQATGSTVFVNITRPYCDAAAARVGDMLLPTDDRAWSIKPTPLADLVGLSKGDMTDKVKQEMEAAAPQDDPEAAAAYMAQTTSDIQTEAKAILDEAAEKARAAEKRIEDWHVECQYHAEVRRVIEDAVKSGSGVLKGPIPELRKVTAFKDGKLVTQTTIVPVSRRVSRWNLYPDPACGESIHNGSFLWERDEITRKSLEKLRGGGDYLDDQISAVLAEGPHKATDTYDREGDGSKAGLLPSAAKNLYEIWYGYCRARADELMAAGLECDDEDDNSVYDVVLTMVNNRVIKAHLNHLDTGEFPYDVFVWQRREGMWAGVGVSRQIRTPQRIVNGAARNLMDNAGLSGGPMFVMKQGIVTPMDGIVELRPRKGWWVAEDADVDDVSKAFAFIQIPMVQDQLQAIIQLGLKMAEDVTGLPMLMQGQQGAAPDTVGGMQILNNNAGTVLRRVARLFDDTITEPHVRRYYTYLLTYGEDEEKGDFLIDARGSSALVERDLQNQQIMQLGQMIVNPVFGKDPKKWMDEHLKAQKLDPKKFNYDDEEWQKIVESMSQPPSNPAMDVANIRAQVDQAKLQHDAEQRERDRELEIAFKGLDHQLAAAIADLGNNAKLSDIKAALAGVAMKIAAQREMSGLKSKPGTPQVAAPAFEPPGRAPAGQAFQR